MKLNLILEWGRLEIVGFDDDDWETAEACYEIARRSYIRIANNKNLTLVAMIDGTPVGAVWTAFERDGDASEEHGKEIYRYDFDIAVDEAARVAGMSSPRVGPQLIAAALSHYKSLQSDVDGSYIRVWVVNPKLARYLEDKYGFEPEGREWSRNSPHMTYYG